MADLNADEESAYTAYTESVAKDPYRSLFGTKETEDKYRKYTAAAAANQAAKKLAQSTDHQNKQ